MLLLTKNSGWHYKSIPAGVENIKALAKEHYFNMVWHEDASHFNDEFLSNIDVVIFMMTSGDILDNLNSG